MIRIGKTTLVIVSWRADYARTYLHEHDDAICLSCGTLEESKPYLAACNDEDHRRHQVSHVTKNEAAPLEAKRAAGLYGKLYREFHKLGYPCGDQVYLLGADADLEGCKSKLRVLFDEANAEFKHVKIGFDLKELVLVPGELNEETLSSIRRDVEKTIQGLIEALQAASSDKASVKAIKEAGQAAKNMAAVLEGDSRLQAQALSGFAKSIVDRLKKASEESTDVVEKTIEESRSGAARFAAIFAGEEEEAIEQSA